MSQEEIQLTPAERRLLRKLFHRHAAPYLVIMGLVTVIAVATGDSDEFAPEEPAAVAAAPPVDVEALRRIQDEAQALLAGLTEASEKRQGEADAAMQQIAALEKRFGATSRRLGEVEAATGRAQAAAEKALAATPPAAAAPAASEGDAAAILERLYNVEVRQDQVEASGGRRSAERTASIRALLDRLGALEARTSRVEEYAPGSGALPAAPAPGPAAALDAAAGDS